MASTTDPSVEYIKVEVEKNLRAEYEAKYAKEIADEKQRIVLENDKAFQEVIKEFRESQTPPTIEQITTLLSQEYIEIKVQIPDPQTKFVDGESPKVIKTITITELPQRVEKAFYKNFKEQLLPRASDLGALTFDMFDGDVGKKIKSLLETFEPMFDLLADACVMIIDPRKTLGVNREWVQDNLSSYRQYNIIYAQFQVNRLRDFFSQISRGSKGTVTTLGVSTRN